MFSLKDFLFELEKIAPLSLSQKMIEKGSYDNSGIIIESHQNVNKVMFSLDLSEQAVLSAIEKGCDTIVTHHPAIYMPIKSLSENGLTRPLVLAIKSNVNVISMHLNLDIADDGIDQNLAIGLGAKNPQIIDLIAQKQGYGRVFDLQNTNLADFVEQVKNTFNSNKILSYGNGEVKKVISFCGSGGDCALSAVLSGIDSDTVVSSDIPHHVLKELLEKNKNVVVIPHYVSENYGFNEFFKVVEKVLLGKVETFYFEDKRFM